MKSITVGTGVLGSEEARALEEKLLASYPGFSLLEQWLASQGIEDSYELGCSVLESKGVVKVSGEGSVSPIEALAFFGDNCPAIILRSDLDKSLTDLVKAVDSSSDSKLDFIWRRYFSNTDWDGLQMIGLPLLYFRRESNVLDSSFSLSSGYKSDFWKARPDEFEALWSEVSGLTERLGPSVLEPFSHDGFLRGAAFCSLGSEVNESLDVLVGAGSTCIPDGWTSYDFFSVSCGPDQENWLGSFFDDHLDGTEYWSFSDFAISNRTLFKLRDQLHRLPLDLSKVFVPLCAFRIGGQDLVASRAYVDGGVEIRFQDMRARKLTERARLACEEFMQMKLGHRL